MSEVLPSGGERDAAAELLASARARAAAALADLAMPARLRLSDRQRAVVDALLAGLVRAIEDPLRSDLANSLGDAAEESLRAALASARVEIALPILRSLKAVPDAALIGVLLRRAEEHRLHRAAAAENGLLLELSGDADEALAADAMALLIAHGARLDAFQEPIIPPGELSAELAHRLVWTVAAAMRHYMTSIYRADPAAADAALAAAASRLLAGHDEGAGMDARCLRLVRRLHERGRLGDDLLARALGEGHLPLFLAAVGARAGVEAASAWEIVSDPTGRGAAMLLRAAGIDRAAAAAILLAFASDEADMARRLDLFDAAGEAEARDFLTLWRADPGYRSALGRLVG